MPGILLTLSGDEIDGLHVDKGTKLHGKLLSVFLCSVLFFSDKPRSEQNTPPRTARCGFSLPVNLFLKNDRAQLLMQKCICRANLQLLQ